MPRRRRTEDRDEVELAAGVLDAQAVPGADGHVIAWDESASHQYELVHVLQTARDGHCTDRKHI